MENKDNQKQVQAKAEDLGRRVCEALAENHSLVNSDLEIEIIELINEAHEICIPLGISKSQFFDNIGKIFMEVCKKEDVKVVLDRWVDYRLKRGFDLIKLCSPETEFIKLENGKALTFEVDLTKDTDVEFAERLKKVSELKPKSLAEAIQLLAKISK